MIFQFGVVRKFYARLGLILFAMFLAACDPSALGNGPSINPGNAIPVALLVPSASGNAGDEVLATSLINAARLAIADLGDVQIDLRIYSTAGQPATAARAAVRAVDEGAKVILGPVFSQSASAVGAAVAARNINVLSFSNNAAVAGGNVFVLGPTFRNTANRLARYSVSQGVRSILIVNGDDAAERIGRDVISQAVVASGGLLAGVSTFELSQEGVIAAVPSIIENTQASGAQAIFLTSGTTGALPFLAQLLPEAGLDPTITQYIGLQRWDIPVSALTLAGLQNGWFALPDPGLSSGFSARFNAAYGGNPHPIAGLAYDGIAAIGALVGAGHRDALTRPALTQSAGFVGVNGVFRLLADGSNERGLAVAQIVDNQVVIIDPAPRNFGGGGF